MDTRTANTPLIGEVYMMQFDGIGSEQRGIRPGLVFQNNVGNEHSPTVIALPLTTARKNNLPTHVFLSAKETGLPRDSTVLCEAPQQIDKSRILNYVTTLDHNALGAIAQANFLASASIAYIDVQTLMKVYNKACKLNKEMPHVQ